MFKRLRLLIGISIFWLALSMLSDGMNTLILPIQIKGLTKTDQQATILGLLTFVGLLAGAVVQPIAGTLSDRWKPRLGRKGFIGLGVLLSLVALFVFVVLHSLLGVMLSYLAIQVTLSFAQAGQQGLLPDLVDEHQRGMASGLKGFMDIAGAMLGFIVLGQLLGSGKSTLAVGVIAGVLVAIYVLAILLTPEDHQNRKANIESKIPSLKEIFRLNLTQQQAFVRLLWSRFLFLFGIYAIGRFLLLFVASRLGLDQNAAAKQAGSLLAALTLITILASPLAGWLADRWGRLPLMIIGSVLGAISAGLLIWSHSSLQILLFGGLMSLGSAAFSSGSWALLADLVPKHDSARYFGLANFSTTGAAAVAGLLGPLVDWGDRFGTGIGYSILFMAASLAFLVSVVPLRHTTLKVYDAREKIGDEGKVRADNRGLAVVSLPANPAGAEKNQNP